MEWNKKLIKEQIKYLKDINTNNQEITNTIYFLKSLISNSIFDKTDYYTIEEDTYEYKKLKKYNQLINKIIKQYKYEPTFNYEFKPIISTPNDILLFTIDNIKNINKEWYKTLTPFLNNKDYIKFKPNNSNYVYYSKYLNHFYISLNKENNINDFVVPTHEFLHIYTALINKKAYYNIEGEFLSILGELITVMK